MRMDQKRRGGIRGVRDGLELRLGTWCCDVQTLVIWEQPQGAAWYSVKCWWTGKRKMLLEPLDLSNVKGKARSLVLWMLPQLETCWWVVVVMLLRARRKKKSFWSVYSEIFLFFFFSYVRKIETKRGKTIKEKNPYQPSLHQQPLLSPGSTAMIPQPTHSAVHYHFPPSIIPLQPYQT